MPFVLDCSAAPFLNNWARIFLHEFVRDRTTMRFTAFSSRRVVWRTYHFFPNTVNSFRNKFFNVLWTDDLLAPSCFNIWCCDDPFQWTATIWTRFTPVRRVFWPIWLSRQNTEKSIRNTTKLSISNTRNYARTLCRPINVVDKKADPIAINAGRSN